MSDKLTQKQIILAYLKQHGGWVREYLIRGFQTDFGWIGARGDRDVRELVASKQLLANKDGKYRIVKYKPMVVVREERFVTESFLNQRLSGEDSKNNKLNI